MVGKVPVKEMPLGIEQIVFIPFMMGQLKCFALLSLQLNFITALHHSRDFIPAHSAQYITPINILLIFSCITRAKYILFVSAK
jgi:hypothetical protein